MKTPHKHSELIKAWADGAEIQVLYSRDWKDCVTPLWDLENEYRIKPEPKPKPVVLYATTWFSATDDSHVLSPSLTKLRTSSDNIKLTFHGETKELIKAEVI